MERIVERPAALDVHKASYARAEIWHYRKLEELVQESRRRCAG